MRIEYDKIVLRTVGVYDFLHHYPTYLFYHSFDGFVKRETKQTNNETGRINF